MGRIFSWTSAILSALHKQEPGEYSAPVQTNELDSQSIPVSQCTIHAPGHRVTPSLGLNASNMTWQEATIMAVRGTHVQLKINGQSRNFWNHDSARLFEFLGATDGQVRDASGERKDAGAPVLLWNEEHQLLGLRDGKIFSLSHLSPEPLTACVTAENR